MLVKDADALIVLPGGPGKIYHFYFLPVDL